MVLVHKDLCVHVVIMPSHFHPSSTMSPHLRINKSFKPIKYQNFSDVL